MLSFPKTDASTVVPTIGTILYALNIISMFAVYSENDETYTQSFTRYLRMYTWLSPQ